MPTTIRRHAHHDSSESDQSNVRIEIAQGAHGVRSEDDRDSSESDDHGDHTPAIVPNVLRELSVLQRQMIHNFGGLHGDLRNTNRRLDEQRADTNRRFDEQRADTNRRLDEQRADTNRRFDEHGKILGQLEAQLVHMKAQQINQRATHINNPVQPVGRDDGTPIPTELSQQYNHVHKFLRLKHRDKSQVLAALLRFYGLTSTSWSTWGLISMSSWDRSDTEEPLMTHDTLEIAISWAPEIALQELARYLGLDYDKITINVEEYENLQQRRATQNKRAMADELASSKRERLVTPERQGAHIPQADRMKKPASIRTQSEELGWDARATEDRTPVSQRPRFKDGSRYRQPSLSPTSVATSDAQLPSRTKQ
ncbi:hypothetical protein BAUCODRAFT_446387 [Baudoinia panamericana UAMH 10762]|uniref:Uncharacterized protein n=1 Tax=Baudoinia panamericana (strain UAMH 10762) TaxID=717646 RepID=M2NDK5_BAUPA|nr:uncharacterized protein BAUCODRAFT_446387 [Baudoinia panamericana UAMH 10762]EMC97304.1 hypothetical protein BAUCODRAFT_446387 [Baudoinia panamericana UAMH 10762]